MRAATKTALLAAAAALLLAVAVAGADSEDPATLTPADNGPRHQLRGSWKVGPTGKVLMTARRGRVTARVTGTTRVAGCSVPRGISLLRWLRFDRRELQSDVWVGRVALPDPDRGCRRGLVSVTVRISSDLSLRAMYRQDGVARTLRLRRIRPRVSDEDPVLGTWELRHVGIRVERRGDVYVGIARDAFLLSNNCTVPAGELVWRLRPSAPERYDGQVQTFMPPPGCEPAEPSDSRWRLEEDDRLVREQPDGSASEYTRAAE